MSENSYPTSKELSGELIFVTSRSSGPGGQNVNKVNSKVTLKWDVANSQLLTDEQRDVIFKKLSSRMTKDNVLILTAQDSRSQIQNKEEVISRFGSLLGKAFAKQKARKATKPSKAIKRKRLENKKQNSEKKQWRKRIE